MHGLSRVFYALAKRYMFSNMKLLRTYQDISDAERLAKKLEANGILTFVSSKKSHSLSSALTGAIRVGVWVVLDSQYRDAISFLDNKNHQIQSALSPEEIKRLKEQTQESTFHSLNTFMIYASVFIVLFFGCMYLLVKNSNGI